MKGDWKNVNRMFPPEGRCQRGDLTQTFNRANCSEPLVCVWKQQQVRLKKKKKCHLFKNRNMLSQQNPMISNYTILYDLIYHLLHALKTSHVLSDNHVIEISDLLTSHSTISKKQRINSMRINSETRNIQQRLKSKSTLQYKIIIIKKIIWIFLRNYVTEYVEAHFTTITHSSHHKQDDIKEFKA